MWSWNYCFLVFLAVLGVFQLAAAHNNFRGLLFFPAKAFALVFGAVAIGLSLFDFFVWYDINDYVVEGSQQTGLFALSASMAIVFTLFSTSLLNHRRFTVDKPDGKGLDALRESTFFQAIHRLVNGKDNDR